MGIAAPSLTFSLENEYDWAAEKPSRGYGRSWVDATIYRRDPGEIAYDEVRGLAYGWNERVKGQSGSGGMSTPRSDAAYDYRRALRYGDDEAAQRQFERMGELGMSHGDLAGMLKRAAPLGPLAKKDRAAFVESLTTDEREKLQRAEAWYAETFRR